MSLDVTLLLGAIGTLTSVIGILWRVWAAERVKLSEATRLIFALLGERAERLSEKPPATDSTPAQPQFQEARQLAEKALNGDVKRLLDEYLTSTDTPAQPVRVHRG